MEKGQTNLQEAERIYHEWDRDGLIWYHRVYWGWKGFQVMQENAYHAE